MNKKLKIKMLLASMLFSCFYTSLFSQKNRLIAGVVIDAQTNSPLPFATVSLKKQLIGTACNENGEFEFYIPNDTINDTLLISYLGYKHRLLEISSIHEPIQVKLETASVELSEIVIRPLPPEYYITMAMNKLKENYPGKPFLSEAYYREVLLENDNFIKSDEGVFRTIVANFLDTIQSQHQLLLYRRANDLKEIAFMNEKSKKKKAKEKNNDKNAEKKNNINFVGLFGGPKVVLNIAKISKKDGSYLDSNNFRNYNYSFGQSSTYDNQELIKVDFISKGTINHAEWEGSVYINVNSFAIVKSDLSVLYKISAIKRAAMNILYGVKIEHPKIRTKTEYQFIADCWYPKNVILNIDLDVSKNHWFSPDEHAAYKIEEIFTVNKIQVAGFAQIDTLKIYDPKKEMGMQVYNDDNLSWEGINIIKK